MIHVIAIVTTRPGQRDEVLRLFQANVPAVKAEQGCLEYEATVDTFPTLKSQTEFGPDTFVVVEKWETPADLEAHGASSHMVAYGAKTRDLVASRMIHVLSPV